MPKRKYTVQGKCDGVLLGILATMIISGLIMVFSASAPSAFYLHKNQYYFIAKQAGVTIVGAIGMFIISRIDYRYVKRWAYVICIIAVLLMFAVPLFGVTINGARRWLKIGITFQPSEIAKFAIIFCFARRMADEPKNHLRHLVSGVLPYILILGIFVVAMILQHHLSAILVTFATAIVMLVIGGANIKHFILMCIAGISSLIPLAIFTPYRLQRLTTYRDPFADITGDGWQIVQGLYAIGSGGIFGRGLGQARQKFLYVPEAHNDYIYAIWCEEFGLIGAIALAALFVALIVRCLQIAEKAPDKFSKMTVIGIALLIGFQYLINIGVVTATIPNTGMQLPFFSAGGTSLIFLMAAMGVVLNISRHVNLSGKKEGL